MLSLLRTVIWLKTLQGQGSSAGHSQRAVGACQAAKQGVEELVAPSPLADPGSRSLYSVMRLVY